MSVGYGPGSVTILSGRIRTEICVLSCSLETTARTGGSTDAALELGYISSKNGTNDSSLLLTGFVRVQFNIAAKWQCNLSNAAPHANRRHCALTKRLYWKRSNLTGPFEMQQTEGLSDHLPNVFVTGASPFSMSSFPYNNVKYISFILSEMSTA